MINIISVPNKNYFHSNNGNSLISRFNLNRNLLIPISVYKCTQQEESLAVYAMLSTGMVNKKAVTSFSLRAEMEARVAVLRRTRHEPSGLIIEEILLNNVN